MTGPWSKHGTQRVPGGVLHWASVGTGEPLVLIPKVGGWIDDWAKVATLLARGRRIIAIDLPGHGGSRMEGSPPFIIPLEHTATSVMLLLDSLGVGRFVAAGNSLGGLVLLAAAANFPGRIERLAMVSCALIPRTPATDLHNTVTTRRDIYDTEFTFEQVDVMFSLTRETYHGFVQSQHAAGDWKNPSIRGVAWSGPLDLLGRTPIPLMHIFGERGTVYSRHLHAILERRPDMRIEIVPDCGSFVHQDKPVICADLIADFMAN